MKLNGNAKLSAVTRVGQIVNRNQNVSNVNLNKPRKQTNGVNHVVTKKVDRDLDEKTGVVAYLEPHRHS